MDDNCEICNKPLVGETWTDDDDYGDVHVRCLERRQDGLIDDDDEDDD